MSDYSIENISSDLLDHFRFRCLKKKRYTENCSIESLKSYHFKRVKLSDIL